MLPYATSETCRSLYLFKLLLMPCHRVAGHTQRKTIIAHFCIHELANAYKCCSLTGAIFCCNIRVDKSIILEFLSNPSTNFSKYYSMLELLPIPSDRIGVSQVCGSSCSDMLFFYFLTFSIKS